MTGATTIDGPPQDAEAAEAEGAAAELEDDGVLAPWMGCTM